MPHVSVQDRCTAAASWLQFHLWYQPSPLPVSPLPISKPLPPLPSPATSPQALFLPSCTDKITSTFEVSSLNQGISQHTQIIVHNGFPHSNMGTINFSPFLTWTGNSTTNFPWDLLFISTIKNTNYTSLQRNSVKTLSLLKYFSSWNSVGLLDAVS